MNPHKMKSFKSKILVLSACLLATMAFTVETHAHVKKNAHFDAGVAAYQANDQAIAQKRISGTADYPPSLLPLCSNGATLNSCRPRSSGQENEMAKGSTIHSEPKRRV